MKFLARLNVEYSMLIEAESEEAALEEAEETEISSWDSEAWSPISVEPEEGEQP